MQQESTNDEINLSGGTDWAVLPIGMTAARDLVALCPRVDANTIVVGNTGSGKSVLLRRLTLSALCRGHQVVVLDSLTRDSSVLIPWLSGYAVTMTTAAAVISDLMDEVSRRGHILRERGVGYWSELPSKVRAENSILPVTLIVNNDGEFTSEFEEQDFSLFPELRESRRNEMEQIWVGLGRLAREARWVGVYVVFTTQRLTASTMPSELRFNFTSSVLLLGAGHAPSPQQVAIVFGSNAPAVSEILELNAPGLLGSAVISDSSGVREFQVDFIGHDEAPQILDALGIPKPERQYGQS